jgi:hypothetical protein
MHSHDLFAFLLTLSYFPLLNAQQLLRAQAPLPTAAPNLLFRQIYTCAAGQTSCSVGGGCCDIGAPCAFSDGIPICQEACGIGPVCTGDLDGLCCQFGYTCNYQSTLCISNGIGGSQPTLTPPSQPAVPSTTIAPPSPPSPPPSQTSPTQASPTTSSTTSTTSSPKPATKTAASSSTQPLIVTPEPTSPASSTTPPAASTKTLSASHSSASSNGQDRLVFSLKVMLACCGLGFFWG